MAKPTSRGGGRVRTKSFGGAKGQKPELPVNNTESNEAGDKQAMLIHYGLLTGSAVITLAIIVFSIAQLIGGINSQPINWFGVVAGVLGLPISFFVGRSMFWLSFFVPIMTSARSKSWASQEKLCRKALGFSKVLPAGASTASTMLVQSLVSRGQFDEAMALGEDQWKAHGSDPKFDENLGPLSSALGLAQQMRGEARQSIVWNERAIECFTRSLDNFANKKSFFSKVAGAQSAQVVGNLKMQLAVVSFNNATSYFNLQNHRSAKVYFQKANEFATQSPDFPEKADLLRASREQVQRLKHS